MKERSQRVLSVWTAIQKWDEYILHMGNMAQSTGKHLYIVKYVTA